MPIIDSYRIRLEGQRTRYVDILATSSEEAVRSALRSYGNACSAQYVGLTDELEARGRDGVATVRA